MLLVNHQRHHETPSWPDLRCAVLHFLHVKAGELKLKTPLLRGDSSRLDSVVRRRIHLRLGVAVRDKVECDGRRAQLRTGSGGGHLATKAEFADFQLHAEFWVDELVNSGVFVRCPSSGDISGTNAYEVNIF